MMRMFFVGLLILLIAMSFDANAQFKPAEQQYLSKENLAKNSGFEQGKTGWTNSNGIFSLSPTEKISGNNGGCVSLTAQTLDFSQTLTTGYNANLASLQGQVSAYAKADFAFQVCSLVDGVEQNCLNNSGLNAFDWYGLPTVMGSTSLGIKFKTSGNVTGTFCTDDIDFGAKQISQAIAQSEIAGEAYIAGTTNCAWTRTSATVGAFNADVDCGGVTVVRQNLGEWQTTDSNLPRFTINNLPAGEYKATMQFANNPSTNTAVALSIFDGTTNCFAVEGNDYSSVTMGVSVSCTFIYSSSGDRNFEIYGASGGTTTLTINNNRTSPPIGVKFILEYYPPKSHIVTQNLEKTVQNSNEFSAKVSNTGVVSGENLDWINGNCSIASNRYVCNLNLVLTNSLNCSFTHNYAVNFIRSPEIFSSNSSSITLQNRDSANNLVTDSGFNIICQKQGMDFNKSQIVYGTFEQIKTTELAKVEGRGNNGLGVTLNSTDINFTETFDVGSNWNGTQFTFPRNTCVSVLGQVRFTTASGVNIFSYIDGVEDRIVSQNNATNLQLPINLVVCANAGQVLSFRSNTTATLSNNTKLHYINIMEDPDLAGIVKNLNDGGGLLQSAGTGNIKVCYYTFGGAGSLLAPTVCSSSPCIEYYDSCNAANPPTRAATGNYTNLTFASGTWKANSPIFCSCESQENIDGNSLGCDIRRTKVWATDSGGGFYVSPYTPNYSSGTGLDSVSVIKCEAEAP